MWMHDGGTGWWIFGAVWMTAFWITAIALIVWAVTRATDGRGSSGSDESPIDIVRRRYARGEITREEFEQLRQDLA
jgi:putative membrane protein